jgi:hypothetical protein
MMTEKINPALNREEVELISGKINQFKVNAIDIPSKLTNDNL